MRRIVVTQNITLDGIVDNAKSWFDPTADTPQSRELQEVTAAHSAASDGFLAGRVTFEEMRGFWPQRKEDRTGVTDHLNRVAKYVVSRTMSDPGWDGTTVLRGGDKLVEEITALKAQDGSDVVLTGSIALTHDLFREKFVDEVRLFLYPVVIGEGRRLFPEGFAPPEPTLVESRTFSGGCVLLRYTL